jgi:hypothetical protein
MKITTVDFPIHLKHNNIEPARTNMKVLPASFCQEHTAPAVHTEELLDLVEIHP